MFVACSTLCFASEPLERALRHILELEFQKIDLAVHEDGPHLKPSQVAAGLESAVQQVRQGPGLTIAALDIDFGNAAGEVLAARFAAMCRFAKSLMVSVLTIPAGPAGTPLEEEARRLGGLVEAANVDGLVLTVGTHRGRVTADPRAAVALCEAVPGLGLTLDPSHYINESTYADSFDCVLPFVQNVHFRDTGRKPGDFQVRVGQGEIEYGRIVNQLERFGYERGLTVAIHDRPDNTFDIELEVRKLKLLLESLI